LSRLRAFALGSGFKGRAAPSVGACRAAIHPRLGIWAKMKGQAMEMQSCACPFTLAKIPILRRRSKVLPS